MSATHLLVQTPLLLLLMPDYPKFLLFCKGKRTLMVVFYKFCGVIQNLIIINEPCVQGNDGKEQLVQKEMCDKLKREREIRICWLR